MLFATETPGMTIRGTGESLTEKGIEKGRGRLRQKLFGGGQYSKANTSSTTIRRGGSGGLGNTC